MCAGRQRRSERLGLEEFWTSLKMHPLWCLHEHLPGLPAQRRPQLWRRLIRPDRLIIDPTFNKRKYSNLPYASSLNGSCSNVCPVKDQYPRTDLCMAARSRGAA